MMTRLTPILALLAASGLFACGPPKGDPSRDLEHEALRFAQATCTARETCNCDDDRYESHDDCEADLVARFMDRVDAGFSYDADCFDKLLGSEAMSCASWPYETFDIFECHPLQGQGKLGDPCSWHADLYPLYATECSGDLSCEAGRCVQELSNEHKSVGEPCHRGPVHTCGPDSWCGDDLICHPHVKPGAPCADIRACEVGNYCAGLGSEGVGTCSELLQLGDMCDPRDMMSCAAPLSWCGPSEDGHACQENSPGICWLTVPVFP